MYQRIKVLSLVLALFGSCHSLFPRALSNSTQNSTSTSNHTTSDVYPPDHAEWSYLNGMTWWKMDPTQQDHARFHAYLSMAAYGDYESLCPATFTKGFTVLEKFETPIGQAGFVAHIPEMEKVVIVFKSEDNINLVDWTPVSISDLISDCQDCKAARGIKSLYISAREQTNDWAIAKAKVAELGLKFSVTGHGVGGAVAALAALHLGSENYVHFSHNHGMPRALNYPAVVKYDNIFQVLAGQSLIAENDYMVQAIPLGEFYHVATRIKIFGPMQKYLINCYGNNENSTCNGDGSNYAIHDLYFTPKGQCGMADKGW